MRGGKIRGRVSFVVVEVYGWVGDQSADDVWADKGSSDCAVAGGGIAGPAVGLCGCGGACEEWKKEQGEA